MVLYVLIVCYISPPTKKQTNNSPKMQVIIGKTKAQRQAESKGSVKASKVRCVSLPEEPIPAKDPRATHSEPIQSATGFVSFLIIVYCLAYKYLEARLCFISSFGLFNILTLTLL